jgi:hypothetical protein
VRVVLPALVIVAISLGLGIAAYSIYYSVTASALVKSASQIHSNEEAKREIEKWNNQLSGLAWTETYDSGQTTNYFARVSNRGIARLHMAALSEVTARVTLHDARLICVTVDVYTPTAPVIIQEWFRQEWLKSDGQNLYLSYMKGAVPIARVQFLSSLADNQKNRAFAVRTRCLLVPRLCASAEDVLPVIGDLNWGPSPH